MELVSCHRILHLVFSLLPSRLSLNAKLMSCWIYFSIFFSLIFVLALLLCIYLALHVIWISFSQNKLQRGACWRETYFYGISKSQTNEVNLCSFFQLCHRSNGSGFFSFPFQHSIVCKMNWWIESFLHIRLSNCYTVFCWIPFMVQCSIVLVYQSLLWSELPIFVAFQKFTSFPSQFLILMFSNLAIDCVFSFNNDTARQS